MVHTPNILEQTKRMEAQQTTTTSLSKRENMHGLA